MIMQQCVYSCVSRTRRHHALRELLASRPASTQEELVAGLADEGMAVTQATVSRDLAALGAVRSPDGYRLPDPSAPFESRPQSVGDERLVSIVRRHLINATQADAIVVLRTAPGHANFVASELDAARPDGMVGCIAGDDTIFLATPSPTKAKAVAASMSAMMGAP